MKMVDYLKEKNDRKVDISRELVKEDLEYLNRKEEIAPFKERFRDKLAEVKQERTKEPQTKVKNRSDMER